MEKEKRYLRIFDQLSQLLTITDFPISRMATINAILYKKMDGFYWAGFYLLYEGELIVGPYQGSLACQKLQKDTGVCWAGINKKKTIIVPDVHMFLGHIECDTRSNSEIVVPVFMKNGTIAGVLDIDSCNLNHFDEIDTLWLEKFTKMIYL
jgi:L-methionine (R)-S-oxide reductase